MVECVKVHASGGPRVKVIADSDSAARAWGRADADVLLERGRAHD